MRASTRAARPQAQPNLLLPPLRADANSLLFLLAVERFLAGVAELIALLVETGNDPSAAGRGAGAEFLIIGLAGAALIGGRHLRKGRTGESDCADDDGEA